MQNQKTSVEATFKSTSLGIVLEDSGFTLHEIKFLTDPAAATGPSDLSIVVTSFKPSQ